MVPEEQPAATLSANEETNSFLHNSDETTHVYDLAQNYCIQGLAPSYPTGINDLDEAFRGGGLGEATLTIIGGRASEGKTSLALWMAKEMALERDLKVWFFSLESTSQELIERLLCQHFRVSTKKLDERRTQGLLSKALDPFFLLSKLRQLHLFDSLGHTTDEIEAKLMEAQHKGMLPNVLFIDHLQHAELNDSPDMVNAIRIYLKDLKRLAKAYRVAIVLNSQLNRAVYENKDQRPHLKNLKSSGSIEEIADHVLLVWRLNYGEDLLDPKVEEQDVEYRVFVAKNRNGPLREIAMVFRPWCYTFLQGQSEFLPKTIEQGGQDRAAGEVVV